MSTAKRDFIKDAAIILESVPDLYLILDTDFKIVCASQCYLNATMTESHQVIGRGVFDLFALNSDSKCSEQLRQSLNRVLLNKIPDQIDIQPYDIRRQIKDGLLDVRYWGLQNSPVLDKKNNVKYIIHRLIDMTSSTEKAIELEEITTQMQEQAKRLREKEMALMKANRQLELDAHNLVISNQKRGLMPELGGTLIACNNQHEMVVVITSFVSKILDFGKGVLYLFEASHTYLDAVTTWGNPLHYEQVISPEECWAIRRGFTHETKASESCINCEHIKTPDHDHFYLCVPVSAQNEIFGLLNIEIENDDHNQLTEYYLLINMVSKTIALSIANITLRNLLRDQSIRDALTGVYNRRFLDEYLIKHLFYATRHNTTLAVIMLDIDDFKQINDKFGHDMGDIILGKLGHLLTNITRADDLVCRYGGEEFIYILQNCSIDSAKMRAEELRLEVNKISQGPQLARLSISLGVSMYPMDATTAYELIDLADKALYHSKELGKNRVTAYCDIL